jgi:hypothetical protein
LHARITFSCKEGQSSEGVYRRVWERGSTTCGHRVKGRRKEARLEEETHVGMTRRCIPLLGQR